MVGDIHAQQGLHVDILAVRVLVGARFADVCAHDSLLVALRVVVAGGEGRLAETRHREILFFDVVAVCKEGLLAPRLAEVCERALDRCVVHRVDS